MIFMQNCKIHAVRSLFHCFFESRRNKVIRAKVKLHDLLTVTMFFADKQRVFLEDKQNPRSTQVDSVLFPKSRKEKVIRKKKVTRSFK